MLYAIPTFTMPGFCRSAGHRFACIAWCVGAVVLVIALASTVDVYADTNWTGTVNGYWSNASNWTNGVPGTSQLATFTTASITTTYMCTGGLLENQYALGLVFSGESDFVINTNDGSGGGTLYLYGGGIVVAGGTQTITAPPRVMVTDFVIDNDGTLIIDNSLMTQVTGMVTFSGDGFTQVKSLSRRYSTNELNVVKTGEGVLQIVGIYSSAATTTGAGYSTGTTTINGGTVSISQEANLGGNPDTFNAGLLTLDGGTLLATASFAIDDSNRGLTIGANGGTFEVDPGQTLTITNVITGDGGLVKTGEGVLTLQNGNTYTGTTTVEAGLLDVTGGLLNNGPADILIRSAGTSFGSNDPRIARLAVAGLDLSAVSVGSSILGGRYNTSAELLAGTASEDLTMTMAWREKTAADTTVTGCGLVSDVLSLEGTGSDVYVLQMSYDPSASYAYLAWLDGDYWAEAVDGNSGATGDLAVADYQGAWSDFTGGLTAGWTLDDVLGSYGYDATNSVAWAVLDHSSQFAVVPEPGTCVMLLIACIGGILMRRVHGRR